MIQFSDVSKIYNAEPLFEGASFALGRGERVGLVGRNGTGKSTILRLILGEEHPDSGSIILPRNYWVGHLAQHLEFNQENIVKEACLGLPEDERDEEYRAEIILSGLGFSEDDYLLPASRFSGGFQIRLNLAKLILSAPNLLLLDEPTNYLDIVSARWLTRFLKSWPNELIVISHDREFLDSVTTHSMLIHREKVRKIPGSTAKLYNQIATEEEVYEGTRVNEEKKRKHVETFINRFRAKATKARAVQSRIKQLDKMGTKEALADEESLDFAFSETPPFYGRYLLEVRELAFGYDPENLLLENLTFTVGKNDRIGVIGKNGKGKSTLLRLLAGELTPNHGTVDLNLNTKLGYFGQTNIARLDPKLTIEEEITSANSTLSRTRVRNICGTMMFSGDDALKKVGVISGGEKSRVLLGKILAQPTNLLLLDEPTNHLDIESIEALVDSTKVYQGAVIIVTHNEEILRNLCTRLIVFQDDMPVVFEGGYDHFLEKIGWVEEEGQAPSARTKRAEKSAKSAAAVVSKPELGKRERAELVNERSKILTPLTKRVDSLEAEIVALERLVENLEQELVSASAVGDGIKIKATSQKAAASRKAIELKFDELEKVSKEYEQEKRRFEELL